jgi:hypothetical protein
MSPRTRKRRRSQAFLDDPQHVDTTENVDVDAEALANAKLEKEGEIWDAFREEHYEGTCHRRS